MVKGDVIDSGRGLLTRWGVGNNGFDEAVIKELAVFHMEHFTPLFASPQATAQCRNWGTNQFHTGVVRQYFG